MQILKSNQVKNELIILQNETAFSTAITSEMLLDVFSVIITVLIAITDVSVRLKIGCHKAKVLIIISL